jgi:hypothetical protein
MDIKHTHPHTTDFIDEAAMTFMALTVNRLNRALIENGVSDSEKRQEICGSFLFEFAYRHDAGWQLEQDKKLFPVVCFAERAEPDEDSNLGAITTIHIPTEASSWHEYAFGVVSQYFEDYDESVTNVRTGSYSNEDE